MGGSENKKPLCGVGGVVPSGAQSDLGINGLDRVLLAGNRARK
ncbi:hypothetical protein [Xenorhabdus beddingii]|nr:hypothetical protein [Xenorhabdus beddingii]